VLNITVWRLQRWMILAVSVAGSMVIAFVVSRPELQRFIENSGVNIPTNDVLIDYGKALGWASVLMLSILAWPVRWEHKKMLLAAWLVRCFICLVVALPYEERYYGLDCWTYFQRSHAGFGELMPSLARGGTDVIVGLGALHLEIGPDSYHAMKLSFAMFGFVAIYLFYRSAELLLGRVSPLVFWGLTLYPSVLFWSSIFGKDPVVLAAIALHVWGLVNVITRHKNGYLFAVLAGIGAASAVRIWMGPILLIPCLLILGMRIQHLAWRVAAVALTGLALATLGPATVDRLELAKASDLLEATRNVNRGWERANSSIAAESGPESLWELALFTPESMFIAYFRPLPGDVPNLFGWLAGIENCGLLAGSIWALFRFRFAYLRQDLFLWGTALLLSWGLAYSVVAYKDLGTAVRFKLQILPILLGIVGFLMRSSLRRAPAGTQQAAIGTGAS
jgi:hypothetical protein